MEHEPDPPSESAIVLFSAQYPPHTGGVETYAHSLAHALAKLGRRVVVVCLDNCQAAERDGGEGGVEVLRLPCHRPFSNRYPLVRRCARTRELLARLEAMPVDHVLVNARFYPLSLFGARFARRRGIAPVLVEHGSAHLTLGCAPADAVLAGVEHAMTALVKRSGPRFYGVSRAASDWLCHFGIEPAGELNNAIDADAFRARSSARDFRAALGIGPDDLLVASVGRLVPEKGVAALLDAMRNLADEPIWCLFAGDGPLRANVERCGLKRVRALGNLGKPDVAALFCQANALCLPSRSEGFATCLLEAAACGTPAIVTRVGGVDELAPDERFGTVLDDAGAASVEAALRRALEDPDGLAAQGLAVRQRVERRFTWRRVAEAALEACRQANEGSR